MAKRKSTKEKPAATSEAHADPTHPGSERHADETRQGGPRYHGTGWEQVEDNGKRGRLLEAESEDTRTDLEVADDEVDDPGARGAVFGRGGRGAVERDQPDDPSGPSELRAARRGGGPHGHS